MSVHSTSPIMSESPVQVIPMEDTNHQHQKRGQSPRAWTPSEEAMKRENGKSFSKNGLCRIENYINETILISISQSMRTKFLDITHVVNEKSFVPLGVFKDVKIAVAGSTRSVHPSDADTLNNVRRNDSKYEGKNFVEIQGANVARNLQIESNYHNGLKISAFYFLHNLLFDHRCN